MTRTQNHRPATTRAVAAPNIPHPKETTVTTEMFGHEPVDEYDGTPVGVSRIVCARCVTWTRWPDVDLTVGSRVAWSCTSALVLGLAPRAGATPGPDNGGAA